MKNKKLTVISLIMIVIPWTIFPIRTYEWALKSPTAEIMISAYAAFMIFSGIFTIYVYMKGKVKNNLMKVCTVINGLYAVVGAMIFFMMISQKFM